MNILALETSTQYLSLALAIDGKVVSTKSIHSKRFLSANIIPGIDVLIKKSNLTIKDINGLAISLGPGSFTSLRVGLSTVKALAMTRNIPVVGVSSLDIVVQQVPKTYESDSICVMMDAKRGLLYTANYQRDKDGFQLQGEYQLQDIDKCLKSLKGRVLFSGDGLEICSDEIKDYMSRIKSKSASFTDSKTWLPKAKTLAQLAWPRFQNKHYDDSKNLKPIYIYPDSCQVRK